MTREQQDEVIRLFALLNAEVAELRQLDAQRHAKKQRIQSLNDQLAQINAKTREFNLCQI